MRKLAERLGYQSHTVVCSRGGVHPGLTGSYPQKTIELVLVNKSRDIKATV